MANQLSFSCNSVVVLQCWASLPHSKHHLNSSKCDDASSTQFRSSASIAAVRRTVFQLRTCRRGPQQTHRGKSHVRTFGSGAVPEPPVCLRQFVHTSGEHRDVLQHYVLSAVRHGRRRTEHVVAECVEEEHHQRAGCFRQLWSRDLHRSATGL